MQFRSSSRPTRRCAARAVGLRASQRMTANCILGLCARLLRLAQAEQFARLTPAMLAIMTERRVLLRALQVGIRNAAELSCIEAVSSTVADTDRGLLVMMQSHAVTA